MAARNDIREEEPDRCQNSHQKPPKYPVGGIGGNLLNITYKESNSVWKNSIRSKKVPRGSKVRGSQSLMKSGIFGIFGCFFKNVAFNTKSNETFAMKDHYNLN